jgi:hypothetical protein
MAQNWVFGMDYVAYKEVHISSSNMLRGNYYVATKYDGKILKNYISAFDSADIVWLDPSNGYTAITISDTDSGWGESYTPTAAEIQAYFNGWKMVTAGEQIGTSVYNGTGTKAWAEIPKVKLFPTNTTSTTTLPTSSGWTYDTSGAFKPYSLTYQLATPTTEEITVEGQLSLATGGNQVSVDTGIVVREQVTPCISSDGLIYGINVSGSYYPAGSKLKNRANKIIKVYKNGIEDKSWSVETSSFSYGSSNAYTKKENFDPTAVYTADYTMLDKYSITSNVVQMDVEYNQNIQTSVQANTQAIADLATRQSVVENTRARKNQMPWIAPTLLNGWVNYATDWNSAGYHKDEFGNVHLTGFIKNGTVAVETVIFTLPAGYRPKTKIYLSTSSNDSNYKGCAIGVYPDGKVVCRENVANVFLSLDVTPFRAEQ